MLTVAIDAMSGDGGTGIIVDAVRTVLAQREDVHLVLVGDPDHINQYIGISPLPEGLFHCPVNRSGYDGR